MKGALSKSVYLLTICPFDKRNYANVLGLGTEGAMHDLNISKFWVTVSDTI